MRENHAEKIDMSGQGCVHLTRILRRALAAFSFATWISASAFSQSAGQADWSGSIQCQLDVQGQGYSRHEVQTWTLAGGTPSGQGALRQYPATWSVSGSGSVQRMQGAQSSAVKWSINIPPMNAPLAIFVRNSDNNLVIKQATPPRFIPNGISGTRQVTINGVPQPVGQVGHPVREWNFGWIVAPSASTNVSDSSSVDTDGLPAEIMQPAGFPRAASCKWQFTKAGTSPDLTPVSQNCSQASGIAQSFDAMKESIARQYDALIQQTQNLAQKSALSAQRQRLLGELESLKQQNMGPSSQACPGPTGPNTAGGSASGSDTETAKNGSGPQLGANPGQSGATGPSSGTQTVKDTTNSQAGAGPGQNGETVDCSQAVASVNQTYDAMKQQLTLYWQTYTEQKKIENGGTLSASQAAMISQQQGKALTDLEAARQQALAAAAQPCQPGSPSGSTPAIDLAGFRNSRPDKQPQASPVPDSTGSTSSIDLSGFKNSRPDKQPQTTPTIDAAAVKNAHSTKQLKPASVPAPPATSGNYLVTITGLKCAQATLDQPVDGLGDEVYAAAAVWSYNRLNGVANGMPEFHDTVVYGDVSHALGRQMAGSKSPAGGIVSGDNIPTGAHFTRNADASDHAFPLKLFQGTLRDNLDALVISPSVWEYDGSGNQYVTWQVRAKDSFTAYLFSQSQIQGQINTKTFGSFVMDGFGITLPVPAIFTQTLNRPIGLVGKDLGTAIYPTTVVVLTREIIEAALSSSSYNTEPAPGVFISSPGNIVIGFGDHGDANPLLNNTDINDSKGVYYLVLQVEKVADTTQPSDPNKAPTGAPNASQADINKALQKAADTQKEMQDSLNNLNH